MDTFDSSDSNSSEDEEIPMPILSPPQDLNTVRRDFSEAELQPPPLLLVSPLEPERRSRRRKSCGVTARTPTPGYTIDEVSSSGSGFELSDIDISTTALIDSSTRTEGLNETSADSKLQTSSMVDALNAAFASELDDDFPVDLTEVADVGLPTIDKENRTFLYPSISPESSYDDSSYYLEALGVGNSISLADLDLNFDENEYTVATVNDGLDTNEDEAFDALASELVKGFQFAKEPSPPSTSNGRTIRKPAASGSPGNICKAVPPTPTATPKPFTITSGVSVEAVSSSINREVIRRAPIQALKSSITANRVSVEVADSSVQNEQESDDSKKESPESARRKKIRREELDCTLGSYWKIDDVPKGEDFSVRPKRPNAGAKLKALTLNELQNSRRIDHEMRKSEETHKEDVSPARPKRANAGAKMKEIIMNESPTSFRKFVHEVRTSAPQVASTPPRIPDLQKKSPYRVLPYERPVTRGKRTRNENAEDTSEPQLTKRQQISKAYLREKSGRYRARVSYTAAGQSDNNSNESNGSTKIDDFAVISLDKAVKTALLIPDTFSALPHDEFVEKMELELEAERQQKENEIAAAIEKAHRINRINQTRTYRGMRDSEDDLEEYVSEPGAFEPEPSHYRPTQAKFTSRLMNTSGHPTSNAAHNSFSSQMKPKNKEPKISKARQAILKQFEAYEQLTAGNQNVAIGSVTSNSHKRPLEDAMLPSKKKFAPASRNRNQNPEIPLRGRPPTKQMTRALSPNNRLTPVVSRKPVSFVSKRPSGPVRVPVRMRSSWTVTKAWEEDVEHKVVKLGNNTMLIDEQFVRINYTNYVKEADVQVKFDPEARVPIEESNPSKPECGFDYCKLGCICSSVNSTSIVRDHCGKPKCFFECVCSQKFKSNPTLTDTGDIRSRLRPRVSLFNWKNVTRPGEARDSDEETRKVRRVVRKANQGITVPDGSPIKRPLQLPSHLRAVDWKERRLQEIVRRNTDREVKLSAQLKSPPAESISKTTEITPIRSKERSPHKPYHVYPSIPDFGLAQYAFEPPNPSGIKPGVSARYQYNYSLLRRTHGCRPCLVKLVSAPLHLSQEEIEVACAPVNQKKHQSSAGGTDSLGWATRPFQKPTPSSIRFPADRQSFICNSAGEFVGLVEWSKLRNEFPSSRKVRIGSDGGMCVVVTLPIVEEKMAWVFFQVTQSALNEDSVVLPEVGITIESKVFTEQQLSAVENQTAAKVLENTSSDDYIRSMGGLFLLPDLPDYLIYGPHPVADEGNRILIGHSYGMKQKTPELNRKEKKDCLGTGALVPVDDMEKQLENFIIEFVPFGSLDKLKKTPSSSSCVRVTG